MPKIYEGVVMSIVCPIAFRKIDATVSRINAFNVTILLLIFLYMQLALPLYFLLSDFVIRLFIDKKYSPINQLSLFLLDKFNLQSVMVDAGAKRLAAYFALLFTLILIIAHHLNLLGVVHTVLAIFIICTFLEMTFNYCVGCKIYYIIKTIFPKFEL